MLISLKWWISLKALSEYFRNERLPYAKHENKVQ